MPIILLSLVCSSYLIFALKGGWAMSAVLSHDVMEFIIMDVAIHDPTTNADGSCKLATVMCNYNNYLDGFLFLMRSV